MCIILITYLYVQVLFRAVYISMANARYNHLRITCETHPKSEFGELIYNSGVSHYIGENFRFSDNIVLGKNFLRLYQ